MKTDKYIVYHQYSHDAEFAGTRAQCEAWIAEFNFSQHWFFIAHESK